MKLVLDCPIPFDLDEAAAYNMAKSYLSEINKNWRPHHGVPFPIQISHDMIRPRSVAESPISINDNFKVYTFAMRVAMYG